MQKLSANLHMCMTVRNKFLQTRKLLMLHAKEDCCASTILQQDASIHGAGCTSRFQAARASSADLIAKPMVEGIRARKVLPQIFLRTCRLWAGRLRNAFSKLTAQADSKLPEQQNQV